MKALILSAGLGTRLRPLTLHIPKPLIPVVNYPLLELLIHRLGLQGFSGFGINLHHLPQKIEAHLENVAAQCYFSHEPVILGTGGGIAQFTSYLEDEEFFLVHNGDIISNLEFTEALEFHHRRKSLATLILLDRQGTNYVKVLPDGSIIDIRERLGAPAVNARALTFSGIALYDTRILRTMPEGSPFSIIDFLLEKITAQPGAVLGYIPEPSRLYWRDIGNVASYLELHRDILLGRIFTPEGIELSEGSIVTAPEAEVAQDVLLEGFVVIGKGARIGRGSRLRDAVILEDTVVPPGSVVDNAVISRDIVVEV